MRNKSDLKIKAFSLQEMMVVLIITTVIVGMAFAVLNLVQKQMNGIEQIYRVKNDVNGLRQTLWMDFTKYTSIYLDQKKGALYFSNANGERTYFLENQTISNGDILVLEYDSVTFYFENREVSNGEIDAISIESSKETGGANIFVFKENTPETYMNLVP
ncbi:hypothetical protein PP182_18415 [Maribacter sp. PR1]|uniref:Prepilin-type N-terminal cleavage/methylation domain-containing protein n=1 Tax=Maribacter cobaltidurans TaxID=1178778 RepID=A0ABU7IYW2_9FLAO|nr:MULTISPECIES: hypothetical protein [Maribacter]MDC6390667.1 hypothetical protein [Maribacter sp. PR1]MEE1978059.1 hypothetical protein [Maribacter cobaltidurans]